MHSNIKTTHCIFQILYQYELAYNDMDTEFYTCKITNGKTKEFNDQDHEQLNPA